MSLSEKMDTLSAISRSVSRMLIRKNTKAFKTIREIITRCNERADRQQLVRLYITKAGHTIAERVSTESIPGDADLFYSMTYDTVCTNLESSDHQLYQSDEVAGIYFFHPTSNKLWDETPFEFDLKIKDIFTSLAELPMVRKKEKMSAYVFPESKSPVARPAKKVKSAELRVTKVVEKSPRQPDYKLKHAIHFTELDQLVFKEPKIINKTAVLDYYDEMAEYILPYLKDRPLALRVKARSKNMEYTTLKQLEEDVMVPDWIGGYSSKTNEGETLLLCNDKDHLLWYVEMGCLEFSCGISRVKSLTHPDYIVIEIDAPDRNTEALTSTALSAHVILKGMQLPSVIKTDGKSGLHVYIGLDTKNSFEMSKMLAKYICQLIRLKTPDRVVLEGDDENSYGKVTLNHLANSYGEYVTAPYSLVSGDEARISAPTIWDDVADGMQLQQFEAGRFTKRMKKTGDPFDSLFKKKVIANELLKRIEVYYSFLL